MIKRNSDAFIEERKKLDIEEKMNYTTPTLIALGSLQRVTLGGSDMTTLDSNIATPPGPKP